MLPELPSLSFILSTHLPVRMYSHQNVRLISVFHFSCAACSERIRGLQKPKLGPGEASLKNDGILAVPRDKLDEVTATFHCNPNPPSTQVRGASYNWFPVFIRGPKKSEAYWTGVLAAALKNGFSAA